MIDTELKILKEQPTDNIKRPYSVVNHREVQVGRFKIMQDLLNINNKIYPYSYIVMKKNVTILAKKDDKFILYRQYRHSVNEYILEIPAGTVDKGESEKDAALRELREETGYEVKSIQFLGTSYSSCGSTTEESFMYFAELGEKREINREGTEIIEIEMKTEKEMLDLIFSNRMKMSQGLIAFMKYYIIKSTKEKRGNKTKFDKVNSALMNKTRNKLPHICIIRHKGKYVLKNVVNGYVYNRNFNTLDEVIKTYDLSI